MTYQPDIHQLDPYELEKPRDWELQGYADHPHRYNYPKPGTNDETQYLKGWMRADKETHNASDVEWPLGRETYFASYSEKNNLT